MKTAYERLARWRDVGDGPVSYTSGSSAFGEDVIALLDEREGMIAALRETVLQLQYLADKFGETGTGAAVLARVNRVITKATGEQS